MKKIAAWTEADLAKYIDSYIQGKYGRLLNSWFRATIVSVQVVDAHKTLCNIIRPQATSFQGPYPCVTPGFTPVVGQEVECVWRDPHTAYILLPVNP